MKKFSFALILFALVSLMMGGGAFAYDQTDHVKMAPNGEGDLLFFPWYLTASGGWQTQVSVVNTSSTFSTVAKVVVRSHNWSDELLDFLVYLSPNDVWTGYVRTGAQGTYIYSDDDSVLVSKPASAMQATDVATYFASPTNPVSQPLFAVKCPAASKIDNKTDSTDNGYIEVIEVDSTDGLGAGKLPKSTVFNWYEGYSGSPTSRPMVTHNILTGYQEFQNTDTGSYSALTRAQVFADWKNQTFQGTGANTGLVSVANNKIGELEAAMAKSSVAMPYIWQGAAATLHFFTFPTKLSYAMKDSGATSPCDTLLTSGVTGLGDYFVRAGVPSKCITYTSTGYDMKENTVTSGPFSGGGTTLKMCQEMEWFPAYIPGDLFTAGWIRYNWTPNTTSFNNIAGTVPNSFTGAPVLASTVYIRSASVSQADAAWTRSGVSVGVVGGTSTTVPTVYPYYQYSDTVNP